MKVKLDRNLCVGAGNCVSLAPEIFKLDKENKAVLVAEVPSDTGIAMEAAESCPADAITVIDEKGDQVYPRF